MRSVWSILFILMANLGAAANSVAAPPVFDPVVIGKQLVFPQDFGAHPSFRTEWWYVTGWVETPDEKPLGFQITFFRSATDHDTRNPSAFAPAQLVIAHAALSDPAVGHLLHDQKSARSGFGLAYAKEGNTDVKLNDWHLLRNADGSYQALVKARDFTLRITLQPEQPLLLQGEGGYSRKGPLAAQASYYYSEPQLQVLGTLTRQGQAQAISGKAWLDHEWSTSVLAAGASGWDWLGVNLDDGGALMAFQIRGADGNPLWRHAALRGKSGETRQYASEQVAFNVIRRWQSPRTNAAYPVEITVSTGVAAMQTAPDKHDAPTAVQWQLVPLQDDQELDSRTSTGSVYWEGAVTVRRDGKRVGLGYLEMTGYASPIKF